MEVTPAQPPLPEGQAPGEQEALALLVLGADGQVSVAEGACEELLGAPAEALLGRRVGLDAPRLRTEVLRGLERALAGETVRLVRRQDGATGELLFRPRGQGGAWVVARPPAPGPRGEPPLRRGYLRAVLRQVPVAVWVTDRELRITHALGSVLALTGLEPRQAIGKTIAEFVGARDPTEPALAHHLAALAGPAQSFRHTFQGRTFQTRIEPLRGRHGEILGCIGASVDVTERVGIEAELVRARRMLEEAQQVAHVGSFEWDTATDVVTWSDEMHRIYGLEVGTFPGTYRAFLEHIHPEDRQTTEAAIFDAYRNLRPLLNDHRVLRPDGRVRVLHTQGKVITDGDGRAVRLVGSCWDITELKEATAQLEHSVSLLQATLNATADGLLVVDRAGRLVTHNARFLALWGIPPSLVERGDDAALLSYVADQLEDRQAFLAQVEELYHHPEQESFEALRFRDGRVFERYSTPQRVGAEIVGRVWSFRDVTERERLLGRATFLADATRLLASLDVEAALDSVAHLAIPFLGDACAVDLLSEGGPRRLLVVARDPALAQAPEFHRLALSGHAGIYTARGLSHIAAPLVVKDAVVGALSFVAPPGRRYSPQDLEVVEELARRAALSVENARLYRGAQEALQARDDLLTIAAHEIRGPVASMHLAVQNLRQSRLSVEEVGQLWAIIERDERRLARFVEELLEIGRYRSGQLHFLLEEVDLAEVVRDATSRLRDELTRSGSSLTVTAQGQVVGQWDRSRLEGVVTNLLSNAIKFGLGKPIEITLTASGGRARLVVRDHGLGLPPGSQERLFQPFTRGVSVRNYGGLGLGLYIVQKIVTGLGGTVAVESKPGAGAALTVELPQRGAA